MNGNSNDNNNNDNDINDVRGFPDYKSMRKKRDDGQ